VSAGANHTVALCRDGGVIAIGDNSKGQCNVQSWRDIVAVAAGADFTLGLQNDGTVIATGRNDKGQCDVSSWKNIVQISATWEHSIGLLTNGKAIATGDNTERQCDVASWKNLSAVSAGALHSIGLLSTGELIAVGSNDEGQCNVGSIKPLVDYDELVSGDKITEMYITEKYCIIDDGSYDIRHRVMVIDADIFQEEYKDTANQLVFVTHGRGTRAGVVRGNVNGVCLSSRMHKQYDRADIIGELKPLYLPDWAMANLLTVKSEYE
jgi:hypothetical protein